MIICTIMLVHPVSVLILFVIICMILVDILGSLVVWDLDLNSVSAINLVMVRQQCQISQSKFRIVRHDCWINLGRWSCYRLFCTYYTLFWKSSPFFSSGGESKRNPEGDGNSGVHGDVYYIYRCSTHVFGHQCYLQDLLQVVLNDCDCRGIPWFDTSSSCTFFHWAIYHS